MRFESHFPALKNFRFTVLENERTSALTKPCIFLLNLLPFLFQDYDGPPSVPGVTKLELPWPNPEENLDLWKDWTRRVSTKFPNVEGNPHLHKWKNMGEDERAERGGVGGEEDRVDAEWERYERLYRQRMEDRRGGA